MIESVQYALMTETPLVVALVQRLGPSTGGATQGAQGDILLAEFATSGGYTIPVLSPSDALECCTLTHLAFRWAERLRTPVIVLSDKEIAMTSERVDLNNLPVDGLPSMFESGSQGGKGTYWFDTPTDIPAFVPVGGEERVIATGSAHNKRGQLQKNSSETIQVLRHLEEKIAWRAGELEVVDTDRVDDATAVLVTYGITTRAAQEATASARRRGISVTHVAVKSLFPVPWYALEEACEDAEHIIVAEENLQGLYRSVLERRSEGRMMHGVNKIGSMITPREILRKLEDVHA
jgi:2-oxoglutarate ferredoxin oxidoreductase subunit alpha